MNREIALDTETTGLDCSKGDRIVEIGAIEIIDGKITGKQYHVYLNPDREVSADAYRVNGLNLAMLSDKPRFRDIVVHFVNFIEGACLIMHNAKFDIGFMDKELYSLNMQSVLNFLQRGNQFKCTKEMSGGLSLDDLCKKNGIDTSNRKIHGALIDAELTARCYLAMKKENITPKRSFVYRHHISDCLDEFYQKYAQKEESVLIKEIKEKLESLP